MATDILLVVLYSLSLYGCVHTADCPDTWVEYKGACYYFAHNEKLNFYEAQHYCNQHHGAALARAETPQENLFLKDFLRGLIALPERWLGLTDETTESIWEWYGSDTTTEYTDWGPSEPNTHNGIQEDCVKFALGYDFKWADVPCTSLFLPLCEKPVSDGGQIVG